MRFYNLNLLDQFLGEREVWNTPINNNFLFFRPNKESHKEILK